MRNTPAGSTEPHHHLTAQDWQRVEDSAEFRGLVRAKRRFIVPATLFFIVYYFSLPILVGYFPDVMSRRVLGSLSWAYVFALSQFAMAWIVLALYMRRARDFDALESRIVSDVRSEFR